MEFYEKYLKYRNKYLALKKLIQLGGDFSEGDWVVHRLRKNGNYPIPLGKVIAINSNTYTIELDGRTEEFPKSDTVIILKKTEVDQKFLSIVDEWLKLKTADGSSKKNYSRLMKRLNEKPVEEKKSNPIPSPPSPRKPVPGELPPSPKEESYVPPTTSSSASFVEPSVPLPSVKVSPEEELNRQRIFKETTERKRREEEAERERKSRAKEFEEMNEHEANAREFYGENYRSPMSYNTYGKSETDSSYVPTSNRQRQTEQQRQAAAQESARLTKEYEDWKKRNNYTGFWIDKAEREAWERKKPEREARERAQREARERAEEEYRQQRRRAEEAERAEREYRERSQRFQGTPRFQGTQRAQRPQLSPRDQLIQKHRENLAAFSNEDQEDIIRMLLSVYWYAILNIPSSSNENEIKKKYRYYSLKYHPDKCGKNPLCELIFKRINAAQEEGNKPVLKQMPIPIY
jgi:hypothetical protein